MKFLTLCAIALLALLTAPIVSSAASRPPTAEQLAAGASLRGWGNATWEHFEEDVLAAYDGKLERREDFAYRLVDRKPVRTNELTVSLKLSPYEIVGIPMAVTFGFSLKTKKLNNVYIAAIEPPDMKNDFRSRTCSALEAPLIQKYGPPTVDDSIDSRSGSYSKRWNFRHTTIRLDFIRFLDKEISCSLQYRPSGITAADLNKL